MSTGRARLDHSQVVASAIELADRDGLEAASMRGVADRLGVTPMALYKHVASRSSLIDAMLDRVLEETLDELPGELREETLEETPGAAAGGEWREVVRTRVLAARQVVLTHPWAREAIETRPEATPRVLRHMDSLMAAMFAGGLSADLVHHAMHALSTRMWGFTRDVLPTPRLPEDAAEREQAMVRYAQAYPAIVRMATTAPHAAAGCNEDAEVVFALDLLLDGVQRLHESGWSSTATDR